MLSGLSSQMEGLFFFSRNKSCTSSFQFGGEGEAAPDVTGAVQTQIRPPLFGSGAARGAACLHAAVTEFVLQWPEEVGCCNAGQVAGTDCRSRLLIDSPGAREQVVLARD